MKKESHTALWPVIRLVIGLVAFILALLVLVPAPTYHAWLIEIAMTEWGYWAAPAPLLFLLAWRTGRRSDRLAAWLGLASAVLLCVPMGRAVMTAGSLPERIEKAFGTRAGFRVAQAMYRHPPFSLMDLFTRDRRGTGAVVREALSFVSEGQTSLTMQVYRIKDDAAPSVRPAVVIVHGGAWQGGGTRDFEEFSELLAGRGYVVVAPEYRLAPEHRFPAALTDVRAALAFLRSHGPAYGIDPERVVLLGRSAGGQLALLAAYTDPMIDGVIALYAPTDLEYAYAYPANPAVLDSRGILSAYLGGPPTAVPAAYRDASPIRFVGAQTPPTLLIHGERDELVFAAHSARLARALEKTGVPHLFVPLPWATHACDANVSGPCGQLASYAVIRFVDTVFAGPRPRGVADAPGAHEAR